MSTVEFTTELNSGQSLAVPADAANKLPKSGKAKVIVVTGDDYDEEWRRSAYEQFMRDDAPKDAVYDKYD